MPDPKMCSLCDGKALYKVGYAGFCKAHYSAAVARRIRNVTPFTEAVGRDIARKPVIDSRITGRGGLKYKRA